MAVIFDMDGVIADTQQLHAAVESELLREQGILLTSEEITRRFAGVADTEFWPLLFREEGKPLADPAALINRKWEILFGADPGTIQPMPGAIELITKLSDRSVPLAVASASRLKFIEFVLDTLHVREKFSALTSAEEVAHGKPAPDIFLLAAERLSVEPVQCTVIEDGLSGMKAAKNAGMKCVGLLTHVKEGESPADINVFDLRDLDVSVFEAS